MIRKLIQRLMRARLLRALRIVANSALCQEDNVIGLFGVNNRGVLVISGEIKSLIEVVK